MKTYSLRTELAVIAGLSIAAAGYMATYFLPGLIPIPVTSPTFVSHWWDKLLTLIPQEFLLFVIGTFTLTFSLYWILGGLFLLAHSFPYYRIQLGKDKQLISSLKAVLYNQIIIGNIFALVVYPIHLWRGMPISTEQLPSIPRVLVELAFFTFIEEIIFFSVHYLLHSNKSLYGMIHKQHHEWTAPVGLVALYCHPIEHVLANMIPITIGPLILGSHLLTIWIWFASATFITVNVHSGVHLPFLPSPESHDFHHKRFNQNYGVIGLLDYIFGTDKEFRAAEDHKYHQTYLGLEYPRNN